MNFGFGTRWSGLFDRIAGATVETETDREEREATANKIADAQEDFRKRCAESGVTINTEGMFGRFFSSVREQFDSIGRGMANEEKASLDRVTKVIDDKEFPYNREYGFDANKDLSAPVDKAGLGYEACERESLIIAGNIQDAIDEGTSPVNRPVADPLNPSNSVMSPTILSDANKSMNMKGVYIAAAGLVILFLLSRFIKE
jgi:hypothetical protein